MSCKSAIYTAMNTVSSGIVSGSTLPLGTTIRRFGQNIVLSGNGILVDGQGYYEVDTCVTFTPAAADTYTFSLYKDGVAVAGATAQVYASGLTVVPINVLVRQCCCGAATLTLKVTAATATNTITLNNVTVVVKKL